MKNCPICDTIIKDDYIKCPKCKNYIDNSIFDRLSKRDIKIIKKNKLKIYTPSLLALQMENIYTDSIFDEIDKKFPDDDERYKYFLFKSYIYYKCSILRVNTKLNSVKTIINDYKNQIIFLSADLFNTYKGNKFSDKYLIDLAYDIFNNLDDALLFEDNLKMSIEISKIISNERDLIKGFELFVELNEFFKMFDIFSSMFLVEEEDWDWKKIINED